MGNRMVVGRRHVHGHLHGDDGPDDGRNDGPRPFATRRTRLQRRPRAHARQPPGEGRDRHRGVPPRSEERRVGKECRSWWSPDHLKNNRMRVPLGVVAIIYENRPNVTSDAAGLSPYSRNAALLRGSFFFFKQKTAYEIFT